MKLVFIYGPPAAGKLTIAQLLAQQTGFRLFHNHLTVSVVQAIFDEKNHARQQLLQQLRLDGIRAAAENNIDLIFTMAYSGNVDDQFVTEVVSIVKGAGGEVCFVQLTAPKEVLARRVQEPSRRQFGKITDPKDLMHVLDTHDAFASVQFPSIAHYDTAQITPSHAVRDIINHFTFIKRT